MHGTVKTSFRIDSPSSPRDEPLSLLRLHALRAAYLLLVVGLGIDVWPALLLHRGPWDVMPSVVACILAAVSLLALVGLRHPVKMLPLLFFEMVWKTIWLLVVAAPSWLGAGMDEHTRDTAIACLMGAVFPLVVPWRHVWRTWIAAPAERWRRP